MVLRSFHLQVDKEIAAERTGPVRQNTRPKTKIRGEAKREREATQIHALSGHRHGQRQRAQVQLEGVRGVGRESPATAVKKTTPARADRRHSERVKEKASELPPFLHHSTLGKPRGDSHWESSVHFEFVDFEEKPEVIVVT